MRRDCPQRQGSQDFGMPQSRSSMGPAQTQFVPTMGQGNKYQAPGVAQAPSVAHAGQRG